VLGISLHGLFECPDLVSALLGTAPPHSIDEALDDLADAVVPALDLELVERLAGVVQ
jgi:hypothetical protein